MQTVDCKRVLKVEVEMSSPVLVYTASETTPEFAEFLPNSDKILMISTF